MNTYAVPCWMVGTWRGNESDFYLYGSGRALGFVRMATTMLAELGVEHQKEAEYNVYAGISAAFSAIDAAACWLNSELDIGNPNNAGLSLSRPKFIGKLCEKKPKLFEHLDALGTLGDTIGKYRNKLQHRGGSPVRFQEDSEKLNEEAGWFLITEGSTEGSQPDLRCINLLENWSLQIEKELFSCHHEVWCTDIGSESSNEDYAEFLRKKGIVRSSKAWRVPMELSCPYHS